MRLVVRCLASIVVAALSTNATHADEFVLGVSGPLSGVAAVIGHGVSDGARLAAEQINAGGGAAGRKVALATYDDECNPARAAQVTREMIERDKVTALIGYPCAASAMAAAEIAGRYNVLLIVTGGAQATAQRTSGPVLHMLVPTGRFANTVADYMRANFATKKIGLWLPGSGNFVNDLQKSLGTRGRETNVSAESAIPEWLSTTDVVIASPAFAPSVAADLSSKPNLTVVVPAPVLTDQVASAVRESSKVIALTNPTPQFFPEASGALTKAKAANVETAGYFIYAYAAVEVFAEAARRTQSSSGDKLFKAVLDSPIRTILGNRRFDDAGDIRDLYIVESKRSGERVVSVDLCQRPDCHDFEHCPPDCPR
jgi:branched-chain amino acid transport system substrate-binding protein